MPVPTNQKDRGHIAVLKLAVEAESRGLVTLLPSGDNRPYDLVITPDNNKFIRVQVKSCWKRDHRRRHSFVIGYGSDHKHQYDRRTVDIIALYAFDTDEWYILPVEETVGVKNLHVGKDSRWLAFKNNWERLT